MSSGAANGDDSETKGAQAESVSGEPFVHAEALPDDGLCAGACRVLKIVIVGDSGVGKTNLLSRFSKDLFITNTATTVGVDMTTKRLRINSSVVKLQLWDSAGQERFRAISSVFYHNAVGALVVYDLTNRQSFEKVDWWIDEIRRHACEGVSIMLVGNKSDLQHTRAVSADEAKKKATEKSMLFFETSAFSASNVEDAFLALSVNAFAELEAREKKDELLHEAEKTAADGKGRKQVWRSGKKVKRKTSSSVVGGSTHKRKSVIRLRKEKHQKASCCTGRGHQIPEEEQSERKD